MTNLHTYLTNNLPTNPLIYQPVAMYGLIKGFKLYSFQWFEESYEDPDPLPEEISSMNPPISPLMNVEDSVWFEEYTPDQNYDDDSTSAEEMNEDPGLLYDDIFIADNPRMDSVWLDGHHQDQDKGQNLADTSQHPLVVTWFRNLAFLNFLEQISNVPTGSNIRK